MNFLETIFAFLGQDVAQPLVVEMHGDEPRPYTRGEIGAWVAHARGVLLEAGVEPGERVVLLANFWHPEFQFKNEPDWMKKSSSKVMQHVTCRAIVIQK